MSKSNRLGPLPPYEYTEKPDFLTDWITTTGEGVMGFQFGDVPPDCLDFCLSQYRRFNVPAPDFLNEIVTSGACAAYYYLDCIDPYCMFAGISDVNITDDWSAYAYEIVDGGKVHEVDPTSLETFVYVPGQGEEIFSNLMAHPGLDALPHSIGVSIRV
jgi:hypothetical protein